MRSASDGVDGAGMARSSSGRRDEANDGASASMRNAKCEKMRLVSVALVV